MANILNCGATVAILAGGLGTRLIDRSGSLPKSMVSILGKPVLHYQIELCRSYGFTDIALLVSYRYERIAEYFGDGAAFGVSLRYVIEETARGTAGALRDALPFLAKNFLVLYGDTFMDVDLRRLWKAHQDSGAAGTLFLHPNDHPYDSDLVQINGQGVVTSILPYPHPVGVEARNLVNAALYVLANSGLEDVTPIDGKADIAKDMFPRMLHLGFKLYGYTSSEYIKDMGTPERLDKVEFDIKLGLPEKRSNRHLRSAVFLDRDGTINQEVNHLRTPDQIELIPGVAEAVRRINQSGKLAVVVTNQPVVARGDVTLDGLNLIHSRLETKLGMAGAFLDGVYYCPHHPDRGFLGEIESLKIICKCRKPAPGLINQACRDLNISQQDSWMIGDTFSDVIAGGRAGVRTILLGTGYCGENITDLIKPDYIASNLLDAVNWILDGYSILASFLTPIAVEVNRGKRLVLIGGLARSGKSYAAQVLKELLYSFGRKAHVISLDGWIRPRLERVNAVGVQDRYNLSVASEAILQIAQSKERATFYEPLYNRIAGSVGPHKLSHSIEPEDILIVEGVPALLMEAFSNWPSVTKVFMDITSAKRLNRLKEDYQLRGTPYDEFVSIMSAREIDETPIVEKSRLQANFVIHG